tara:strand:- start:187 stop:1515 length:1329 start_codon:yes stop_codon:yes gene_type:complete
MNSVAQIRETFFLENKLLYKTGLISFQIGALILASAPVIAITFLIFSSIIASINRIDNYFTDKYNYPFFIASIFMIINCILLTFNYNLSVNSTSNIWIGLSNWLPFFWCFWSFQLYLFNQELRIKTAKILIFGTIPVLVSCFCQYFLKIYGPYKILNNLIIWYQRPLGSAHGVTGLFNNQNYAGAWLCIILPLCLVFIIKERKNIFSRFFVFLLSLNIVYMIILTSSRNAILSIFISIFLFTKSLKTKVGAFLSLLSVPLILNFISSISLDFQNQIYNLIPSELIKKTSLDNLSNLFLSPRFEIWEKAFKLIKSNIIVGHGAGSFGSIYTRAGGSFEGIQHAHNIFLEIVFSHGIFAGLIIFSMMVYLIISSWRSYKNRIVNNDFRKGFYYFEKAWIISFIIFFLIHLNDITYFDGRISILAWILLAGLVSIIKENNKTINT